MAVILRLRHQSKNFKIPKKSKFYELKNLNHEISSPHRFIKNFLHRDILKSLSGHAKLLSESITERISLNGKAAVHKVEKSFSSSRDKMETWTLDKTKKASKKLKKLTHAADFSSGSSKSGGGAAQKNSFNIEENNRRIVSTGDEMFRDLSFDSPMSVAHKNANAIDDLSRLSMYEVPKNNRKQQADKLPSYDDVVKETPTKKSQPPKNTNKNTNLFQIASMSNFKRNDLISKSLGKKKTAGSFNLVKTFSEANIHDIQEVGGGCSSSHNSSAESLPPPKFPAPVLDETPVYGRVKKIDEDFVVLRNYAAPCPDSNRGTYDVFEDAPSLDSSSISNDKCESWSYMDRTTMLEEMESDGTPEPIYENSAPVNEDEVYGMMCEMETHLLKPDVAAAMPGTSREGDSDEVGVQQVLSEFDPLSDKKNSLNIIESILNGDTYTNITLLHPIPGQLPMPPKRSDSLLESAAATSAFPVPKKTGKKFKKKDSNAAQMMIIHQNLNLRAESLENLDQGGEFEKIYNLF